MLSGQKGKDMAEGYESSVPTFYYYMINEWEVEAVAQKLADPSFGGNVNYYWLVKNLLAQVVIQNHGSWKRAKELVQAMQHDCNQDRENLILMSQDLELEFP